MKIQGKNYRERCEYQLDEWVKGNPVHNNVDDECCPDFSCCRPELLQPEKVRKTYQDGNDEMRAGMCLGFLSAGISNLGAEPVYLADDE